MSKLLGTLHCLETWFERQKRILPWRDQPTPYRVWISEIMLQQTQVITVIPYFERFIQRFPTVESLAHAPQEEVLLYWAGLGYYSRARNLHLGAQKIVEFGSFPQSKEEWLEIPGVGPYTAGAILSIASDQPEPILDGNIERVLSRVRRCTRQQGDTAFKKRLWKLSEIFVRHGFQADIKPSLLNQALMELGATVCTPKNPRCLLCPIKDLCRAYEFGDQEAFPPRKKAKNWVQIHETLHCVLNPQGQVLLRQRQPGEWRAGLWDLLEKESFEKLGLSSEQKTKRSLGEVQTQHVVTHHKIKRKTQVWKSQTKQLKAAEDLRWISMDQPEVAIGSAVKKTLIQVKNRMKEEEFGNE